ncbi:MAG: ABC transporter permease [Sedimentisphaerales bacterium]|jgi:ABC-2 type transport system permease protein|nr:ABC transporter permease [Sedimentisphaerales bacterium]
MFTIFRKEIADHFNSTRFLILFCLVIGVALLTTYTVSMNLRSEISGGAKIEYLFLMLFTTSGQFFSLTQFIAFFGPLIGIIMGFDAINRERSAGTLSKLLSQPVYRDAIINAKFLAGIVTITIMFVSLVLLLSGLGMVAIGVVPSGQEAARLAVYMLISIAYVGFWLGMAILFSIILRSIGTAALASVALWIFVSFFVGFGSGLIADVIAPTDQNNPELMLKNARIAGAISRVSPVNLYSDATSTIMDPYRKTTKSFVLVGPMEKISMSRFNSALSLWQSILVVAPYLTTLVALTAVCFAVSYLVFMRQEVRSI